MRRCYILNIPALVYSYLYVEEETAAVSLAECDLVRNVVLQSLQFSPETQIRFKRQIS